MLGLLPRLGVVVIVIVMVACKPASNNPAPESLTQADRKQVEEMLLGWENEWVNGYVTRDLSVLERILAADFIYTVDSGEVHDKASFIALGADDPISYTRFETSEMSVRWYGDAVVVITGRAFSVGTDADGREVTGTGAWTNVFVRRQGEWRCVVGHSTDVAPQA